MRRRKFLKTVVGLAVGTLAGYSSSAGGIRAVSSAPPLDAEAYRRARKFAATPFGKIAYIERGSGPAAVFLHGFPLNGFQWRGALDRLSLHRRCIAPDFMGLGYTQVAPRQSVAPHAQVGMLTALLDSLSISSVDLVASDSGGAVAQLFTVHQPQRVRTLLLTNCDAEPDSPPAALLPVIALARAGTFADRWLAPWLADKNLARSPEGLGGMAYSDPTHPSDEAIEYYLAPLLSLPHRKALVHAYAIALEANPLAGIEPALKRSSIPTRIVWGTGDTIFSQDSPGYLSRTFPKSRGVRRVLGAKLFFPEEYPDLIAEEAAMLWTAG